MSVEAFTGKTTILAGIFVSDINNEELLLCKLCTMFVYIYIYIYIYVRVYMCGYSIQDVLWTYRAEILRIAVVTRAKTNLINHCSTLIFQYDQPRRKCQHHLRDLIQNIW